jgi:hypothetical protein
MIFATGVVLTAIGALPSASAQSNTYTVDCNRGQKIATALEQGDFRKPVVINVRGTCREFVTITRANVTLRGDPAAEVVAPDNAHDLLTVSADRATLENLTLTGGLAGLSQDHQPSFYAQNVVVRDTSGVGVRVRVGDARLNGCTVQRSGGVGVYVVRGGSLIMGTLDLGNGQLIHSQVLESGGAGVSARSNSIVNLNGVTVMGSKEQGVLLSEGSIGTISGGSTIAENEGNGVDAAAGSQVLVNAGSTIRDNGGFGIGGHSSSIGIDNNTITGNAREGVMGYIGTTLVLHGNVISNNGASGVTSMGNSLVQIGGATIENNGNNGITLAWGAKLILEEPATKVSDNHDFALWCADNESSFMAMAPLDTAGPIECTDFDH